VKTDLGVIRRIFSLLRRFLPDWGWATIYREIREMVLAELDYQHEPPRFAPLPPTSPIARMSSSRA